MNLDVFLFIPGDLEEGARKYKVGCLRNGGRETGAQQLTHSCPASVLGAGRAPATVQGLPPLSGLHRQSTLCAQIQQEVEAVWQYLRNDLLGKSTC